MSAAKRQQSLDFLQMLRDLIGVGAEGLALARSLIVRRVPRPPIASPIPPKRRPRPPLRSRKPRCNRAGTVTVTRRTAVEISSSKSRLPKLCHAPGFSNAKDKSRLRHPMLDWQSGDGTIETSKGNAQQKGTPNPPPKPTMSEPIPTKRYSSDMKRDLPHWYLENGWIRRIH